MMLRGGKFHVGLDAYLENTSGEKRGENEKSLRENTERFTANKWYIYQRYATFM